MSALPIERSRESVSAQREATIALLNQQLADSIDLFLQLKQAHWNVKGPQFASLHELFDAFAGILDGHIDDMAERCVELGGASIGALRTVAQTSRLRPLSPNACSGHILCAELSASIAQVSGAAREAIDAAARVGDAGTADLLTELSRSLDKMLWKIDAQLQTDL